MGDDVARTRHRKGGHECRRDRSGDDPATATGHVAPPACRRSGATDCVEAGQHIANESLSDIDVEPLGEGCKLTLE